MSAQGNLLFLQPTPLPQSVSGLLAAAAAAVEPVQRGGVVLGTSGPMRRSGRVKPVPAASTGAGGTLEVTWKVWLQLSVPGRASGSPRVQHLLFKRLSVACRTKVYLKPCFLTCQLLHPPRTCSASPLPRPLPALSDRSKTVLELSWSGSFYPICCPPPPVEPRGRKEVLMGRVLTTPTSMVPSKLTRGPLLLLWKTSAVWGGHLEYVLPAHMFRGYGGKKLA